MEKALYLIPVTLGETEINQVLPSYNHDIIVNIKHFIVENIRSARRFLKKVEKSIDIDELTFYELNRHTDRKIIGEYLAPLKAGETSITVNFAGGTEATKKTISVVVENAPITSIVLSANKTEIFGDDDVEITATIDQYASLDDVEFTVTPAGIATVTNKSGNVFVLKATDKYVGGEVKVSASDGNVTSNRRFCS